MKWSPRRLMNNTVTSKYICFYHFPLYLLNVLPHLFFSFQFFFSVIIFFRLPLSPPPISLPLLLSFTTRLSFIARLPVIRRHTPALRQGPAASPLAADTHGCLASPASRLLDVCARLFRMKEPDNGRVPLR